MIGCRDECATPARCTPPFGETSVGTAEDLESSALTYAEIKAMASGNPAVVEKIKIDIEIRKLDQRRAVHANQQRHIRWEIRDLPRQIAEARQNSAHLEADLSTRLATDSADFEMTVGNRVFTGKGVREESAVLSLRPSSPRATIRPSTPWVVPRWLPSKVNPENAPPPGVCIVRPVL